MRCPTCPDVDLTMADRQGIEIDYCPKCRGVWLDRGELDKLIERAGASLAADDDRDRSRSPAYRADGRTDDSGEYDRRSLEGKPKKSKGFFSSLFDFD